MYIARSVSLLSEILFSFFIFHVKLIQPAPPYPFGGVALNFLFQEHP
jgi:hypothetical protein